MVVFQDYFEETNGEPFMYGGRLHRIAYSLDLEAFKTLKLTFVSVKKPNKQGVCLGFNEPVTVRRSTGKRINFWETKAPPNIHIPIEHVDSVDIQNFWEAPRSRWIQFGRNGAAMIVEPVGENLWRFECNDGQQNDDCDDLIFTIELLTEHVEVKERRIQNWFRRLLGLRQT